MFRQTIFWEEKTKTSYFCDAKNRLIEMKNKKGTAWLKTRHNMKNRD